MKNNAYKLSTDYEVLWELVNNGLNIVVFCKTSIKGFIADGILLKRGTSYFINEGMFPIIRNKEEFCNHCKSKELGYIPIN